MRVSLKKMDNSKTMISGGFPDLANHRLFFAVDKTIVMISIKITQSIKKTERFLFLKLTFYMKCLIRLPSFMKVYTCP